MHSCNPPHIIPQHVGQVILASRSTPSELTPLISLAHLLHEITSDVLMIVPSCRPKLQAFIQNQGTTVRCYGEPSTTKHSISSRIRDTLRFRRVFKEAIQSAPAHSVAWVAGGDTAVHLPVPSIRVPWVLHLFELYDTMPIYKFLIGRQAKRAQCVVCCEPSRSDIIRTWYQLPDTPLTMPNKPHYHPRKRRSLVTDPHLQRLTDLMDRKKTIMYQGYFGNVRDLRPFVSAVKQMGTDWLFVAMGIASPDSINEMKSISPQFVHIPFVCPPAHLAVTSHAHIGIASYGYYMLNSIFCAPNKIWEYAGFGLPMICQNLPGLRNTVGTMQAGECIDTSDSSAITTALERIDANYDTYVTASTQMYDSIDMGTITEIALATALSV